MDQLLHMKAPRVEPHVRGTNNNTHAFGVGVKTRMTKQAAHETGHLRVLDVEIDQGVSRGAQILLVEIAIERKEGRLAQAEKQADDLLILRAFPPYLIANLTEGEVPPEKQFALAFKYVLVKDVHAATCSTTNSSACLINASLDSLTASAMASFVMLS